MMFFLFYHISDILQIIPPGNNELFPHKDKNNIAKSFYTYTVSYSPIHEATNKVAYVIES